MLKIKNQAFSASSISASIVAFAQFARSNGLNIGIQETLDALIATQETGIKSRNNLRYSLKPLFCTSPEEGILFEKLFILFWDGNPLDLDQKNKTSLQGLTLENQKGSLAILGEGKSELEKEEGKTTTGASETERLRKTDFAKINEIDASPLEAIANKLFREMALRMRRRMKEGMPGEKINLRRIIRRSIPYGGEPIELFFRAQKPKKQRLVILLDVSGSMDRYSFYLLRFVFALRENFRQLEAFLFSTKLIRISGLLAGTQLDYAASMLGDQADNWSSGTKIGNCLEEFNDKYGKRILNGAPVFVILSDGLDTGDPELLAGELKKIQCRSRRIIWLNPLKGMRDYEPVQRGMKAALPVLDDFRSAHNLNSLLELENILMHV
jgi:uncharacterized protein